MGGGVATEVGSAIYSSTRDSIVTLAAIGVVACALGDMTHEVLGHLVVAWLAGVRIVSLSTVAIQTVEASRSVSAAGTVANLIVGALSLVIFNRVEARKGLSCFLWVFAAFNLFNSGYLVASALLGNGDWAAVIGGLKPEWAWRSALGAGGAALYAGSLNWLARSIAHHVPHQFALADLRRLVTTVYLAGGAVLTTASIFNPISPKLILISGMGASFVLSVGLLRVPAIVRRHIAAGSQVPCEPIPFSIGWLGVGIVVGIVLIAVFGPGVHFMV